MNSQFFYAKIKENKPITLRFWYSVSMKLSLRTIGQWKYRISISMSWWTYDYKKVQGKGSIYDEKLMQREYQHNQDTTENMEGRNAVTLIGITKVQQLSLLYVKHRI